MRVERQEPLLVILPEVINIRCLGDGFVLGFFACSEKNGLGAMWIHESLEKGLMCIRINVYW